MKLRDIYASRRPVISVEFFPPKTARGEQNLAQRIPLIKALGPAFCSMTYGAGGATREKTLWWAKRLKDEFAVEVMCHITCVGHSRSEIDAILAELKTIGIENIIALRGDPPAGEPCWRPHPEGYNHAAELVRAARAAGDFSIAVAGFPEIHPESQSRESGLRFLKQKTGAGADVIITQLFLDNADYHRYVSDARAIGISIPIVPGIMPFRGADQLRKFTTLYARSKNGPARIPPGLESRLARVENDDDAARALGVEYATEQCKNLLACGAPGIHFYCLNESKAVESILKNLSLS
ncbi:MAG: methylenetetrahydrofolate reductase [NAD(P)H] [Candidatus Sumerlaeota bacterium]|nr:methylenetetrahydrofolate reductase [NAD(P)H] [Candidatus Sumerlaeota bacterium]